MTNMSSSGYRSRKNQIESFHDSTGKRKWVMRHTGKSDFFVCRICSDLWRTGRHVFVLGRVCVCGMNVYATSALMKNQYRVCSCGGWTVARVRRAFTLMRRLTCEATWTTVRLNQFLLFWWSQQIRVLSESTGRFHSGRNLSAEPESVHL